MRLAAACAAALLAAACTTPYKAPVMERESRAVPAPTAAPVAVPARVPGDPRPDTHTVRRGETLYGIALDYGLDYRELASWNGVGDPNLIRSGQVLRLKGQEQLVQVQRVAPAGQEIEVQPVAPAGRVEARPLESGAAAAPRPADAPARPAPAQAATAADAVPVKTEPRAYKLPYSEQNLAAIQRSDGRTSAEPRVEASMAPRAPAPAPAPAGDEDRLEWGWPAIGRVLAGFADATNKGVDIGGKLGDPVFASASGRVVYSGQGLRGYGKLVIIKHNQTYLSAYAHNNNILVKEGQAVVKGQKIAEIGSTDSDQAKLHFEIRRHGKPVDPLKLLPDRAL